MLGKFTTAMTNDRSLSDTRRIISTLSVNIIELFIPVFTYTHSRARAQTYTYMYHASPCKWQVRVINKYLRFTDRGARNERIAGKRRGNNLLETRKYIYFLSFFR